MYNKSIFINILIIILFQFTYASKKDTTYHKTGEIKRIQSFDSAGKEHGTRLGFYKSGKIAKCPQCFWIKYLPIVFVVVGIK